MTAAVPLAPLPDTAGRAAGGPARLPPVVLVGGAVNALSVARCLGRRGIRVYTINPPGEHICYSRYCTWIPDTVCGRTDDDWTRYLLGPASEWLRGSVLLACNDAGLQVLAQRRDEFLAKYLLDESNPAAQLCMLDKLGTYRAATEAGVPTPRFWVVRSKDQVLAVRDELVYPLLVKPLLSHVYRQRFGVKFATAANFDQVLDGYAAAEAAGVEVMLVEKVPGPDDRLCSYYTYLDEHGRALFDYTKRVIRRFPVTSGPGCYHITDRVPEVKELSLKLFRHVGLRGLGNVEFKYDDRDGRLKLIECNARFTGGNGLVAGSGYDLASFVYNRIVGLPAPALGPLRVGRRLWYPVEDFHAYRQLRRQGELTFWQWLRSVAHRQTFPYFRLSDPWPTLVHGSRRVWRAVRRRLGR